MRTIDADRVVDALSDLIQHCLVNVEDSACAMLKSLAERESGNAKWAIDTVVENNRLAKLSGVAACQDTGIAVVFADIGSEVYAPNLVESINRGVERGYSRFRKSVAHPLTRENTNTNAPAVVYLNQVSGDSLEISFLAKGAGSENMSAVCMLTPQVGKKGIIDCVVDTVRRADANPCPPIVLGVGIGGTMDYAAVLSKRALIRTTGEPSNNPQEAELERDILNAVNKLNIGAQGLGGTTALAVHIQSAPTHIGMLPIAVTVQCHSVRHGKVSL